MYLSPLRCLLWLGLTISAVYWVFPFGTFCTACGKGSAARNDLLQTITAIKSFYTEYSKYPVQDSSSISDLIVSEGNQKEMVAILRNQEAQRGKSPREIQNTKGIVYLEGKRVSGTKPRGGVGEDGTFYDQWGGVYHFVIDTNLDGVVTVPAEWKTRDSGKEISAGIIGFSPGKTDDPKDDVTTW